MDVSAEAADLVVREGIQATEAAAKLAGDALKNVAALLIAIARQDLKVVGETSSKRLARDTSAPAVVIPIKTQDKVKFQKLAKEFGVLYFIAQPGMYICAENGKLGGNVSIPGDMTLEFAAENQRYGFHREVIGGVSYYTREYTFCSATSTYYSDYNIELWAEDAPSGTIFTDTDNNELPHGDFSGHSTWRLPTENHSTTLNSNGYEYSGIAKLCIPVDTAPGKGEITIRCGAYVMQYDIYLAKNSIYYEQSYIIADPSKGTQTANAVLNWGSEQTEKGKLQVIKVNGSGQTLAGASFSPGRRSSSPAQTEAPEPAPPTTRASSNGMRLIRSTPTR